MLTSKVALVAGGTRGAGRGIATELGAAGATVYVAGRTTQEQQSEDGRPETIEETAERVTKAGGQGIAIRVVHLIPAEVEALVDRIRAERAVSIFSLTITGAGNIWSSGIRLSGSMTWKKGCACCGWPSTRT